MNNWGQAPFIHRNVFGGVEDDLLELEALVRLADVPVHRRDQLLVVRRR